MKTKIPSVDELRAKFARQEQAESEPSKAVRASEDENLVLRRELETKSQELERRVDELRAARATPKTIRKSLDEIFERYGVEPAEELVRLAVEKMTNGVFVLDTDQRIQIWRDLLQYRMPKLRAVETHGTVDHNITIEITRFGETKDVGKVIEIPPDHIEH